MHSIPQFAAALAAYPLETLLLVLFGLGAGFTWGVLSMFIVWTENEHRRQHDRPQN
jgi:hypothetical protein